MGIAGALQALPWLLGLGALIWALIQFKKVGRLQTEVRHLRENARIKDEQLKAANQRPRSKSDLDKRLRSKGGL